MEGIVLSIISSRKLFQEPIGTASSSIIEKEILSFLLVVAETYAWADQAEKAMTIHLFLINFYKLFFRRTPCTFNIFCQANTMGFQMVSGQEDKSRVRRGHHLFTSCPSGKYISNPINVTDFSLHSQRYPITKVLWLFLLSFFSYGIVPLAETLSYRIYSFWCLTRLDFAFPVLFCLSSEKFLFVPSLFF